VTTAREVLVRCDALAACSEEPDRITRRFATPALAAACDLVEGWMEAAGIATRRDAAGNVIGRYPGTHADAPTLVLGSHLDSVPNAGRYDGPLGVLCGVACVARLAAEGRCMPFAVEVVGFSDEEGTRFGTQCLGSATYCGRFEPSWLERRDVDGIRLDDAVRAAGGDPDALLASQPPAGPMLGYVELHIEQGPVLEAEDLPVGVVTAIAGQTGIGVRLEGVAGHAGTVPMGQRRDALAGAAELVLAVEAEGTATAGLVATVGRMAVSPGGSNVIPGRVELTIDVRHDADAELAAAVERLRAAARAIAARRRLELSWTARPHPAVTFAPDLVEPVARAVERSGLPLRRLPSGAGHDAMIVASIAPVAMLFVRCKGGISHHPDESVTEADVAVALDVLTHTIDELEDRFR
jgi:allantoate deiminase